MKLVSFVAKSGESWGAVVDGGIVDLGAKLPEFADVRALLAQNGLTKAKAALAGAKADHAMDAVRLDRKSVV